MEANLKIGVVLWGLSVACSGADRLGEDGDLAEGLPNQAGGGGEASEVQGGSAGLLSYQRDIQPIWDRYCVSCHRLQTPHLIAPDSRANLEGKSRFPECLEAPFVVGGQPEKSFLYFKLTRSSDIVHDQRCERWMPADYREMGDTPLVEIDPVAVERVRQWIIEGASAD